MFRPESQPVFVWCVQFIMAGALHSHSHTFNFVLPTCRRMPFEASPSSFVRSICFFSTQRIRVLNFIAGALHHCRTATISSLFCIYRGLAIVVCELVMFWVSIQHICFDRGFASLSHSHNFNFVLPTCRRMPFEASPSSFVRSICFCFHTMYSCFKFHCRGVASLSHSNNFKFVLHISRPRHRRL